MTSLENHNIASSCPDSEEDLLEALSTPLMAGEREGYLSCLRHMCTCMTKPDTSLAENILTSSNASP